MTKTSLGSSSSFDFVSWHVRLYEWHSSYSIQGNIRGIHTQFTLWRATLSRDLSDDWHFFLFSCILSITLFFEMCVCLLFTRSVSVIYILSQDDVSSYLILTLICHSCLFCPFSDLLFSFFFSLPVSSPSRGRDVWELSDFAVSCKGSFRWIYQVRGDCQPSSHHLLAKGLVPSPWWQIRHCKQWHPSSGSRRSRGCRQIRCLSKSGGDWRRLVSVDHCRSLW